MKIGRTLGFFAVLSLWGCSSLVQKPDFALDSRLLAEALSGQAILGQPYSAEQLPEDDLFGLTPEMMSFAERAVAQASSSSSKTEALHHALMEQTGRGITYSALNTTTGIEAFAQRQANCLSYTLLFVAMARHLGVNARYNEVLLPPTWDMREDNTYLFMRHVNAKVASRRMNFGWVRLMDSFEVADIVIDLEMRLYRPHYPQHFIDNNEIAAQYYSNRGMELAASGERDRAFLYLRRALLLNKTASYIWNNLGSFYRRQGMLPLAEVSYLQGLTVNARDPSILYNLVGLYELLGNRERSEYFSSRVKLHREANPYYQYQQAQQQFTDGNYPAARIAIERSLKAEKKEPRFYYLAADIYQKLGETRLVEKMRTKAEAAAKLDGL